jgi:hypothetical protein
MTQLYIRPLFGWHFFRKARAEPLLADLTRPRAPNPNPRPTNRPGATEAAPTLPVAPKCGVARNHRAAAHTPPPYSLNFRARGLSADPPVQPGAEQRGRPQPPGRRANIAKPPLAPLFDDPRASAEAARL